MALIHPSSVTERDRALAALEETVLEGVSEALATLLRGVRARVNGESVVRAASDIVTLGELEREWEALVSEEADPVVRAAWQRGRLASSDEPMDDSLTAATSGPTSVTRQAAWVLAAHSFLADIPADVVEALQGAVLAEMALGSPPARMAERLAAELQWHGIDRGFWSSRLEEVDAQIESILDPLGEPGTPAREAARLNDPVIRELQAQRSQIVLTLDRDESTWQVEASRMARTLSTGGWNAGAEDAYIIEGVTQHAWLATGDHRTRDSHLSASGQCVPLGQPFTVGGYSLDHPGDLSAPPEEVINCRCTTLGTMSCEESAAILEQANKVIEAERQARRDDTD